jgi:tagatose 1,6-diphosphate aldolase
VSVELSAGKYRGIRLLADETGRFRMMAIDQRGSMVKALAKVTGKDASEIGYHDVARVKRAVTKVLSPFSTATLTDPVYGYPYSIDVLPRDTALLLAYEETGYQKSGPEGKERKTMLIEGWNVEKAQHAGADAIKLLLYYRPDASADTNEHQHRIVRQVGEECRKHDMPFLLETVAYAIDEPGTDSAEFARRKPQFVAESAREFSKPEYGVDILKLEFPANLKYCKEFANAVFDDKKREPVYSLDEVKDFCKEVHNASGVPWVILSAGVDIKEFLENVRLAAAAGASGFLCGRAIWKEVTNYFPDDAAMESWLEKEGAENFRQSNAAVGEALPWFDHPKFNGLQNVKLAKQSDSWYRDY